MKTRYLPYLFALLLGGVMLAFPLVRELHFLSASIAGAVGALWAGIRAARRQDKNNWPGAGLRDLGYISVLVLMVSFPLLVRAVFSGCFSFTGLAFWLILPVPSVAFGYAVGRYFRTAAPYPVIWSVLVLLVFGPGVLLYEFFSYPQVYFYNHMLGYWPGPIYDETVNLTPGLLFFRYMTIAWAAVFWLMPAFFKYNGVRIPFGLLVLSLMLCYMNLTRMGLISPETYLQQQLGGVMQSDNIHMHYDIRLPGEQMRWLLQLHEFHLQEVAEILEVDPADMDPVRSYVYFDRWQKKKLTGAGRTSYVPVWNRNPQMHIHADVVEQILRHELVHVVSREFSFPLINASPNIALVEGLAVALESQRNLQATRHQIVAARRPLPEKDEIAGIMSPAGFYARSGPLSYTVAGSFVSWLIENYPVTSVKSAYATGRVFDLFDEPKEELIAGWLDFLNEIPVDTTHIRMADQVFTAPGIIEKKCPFDLSPEERVTDRARMLMARSGYEQALETLRDFIRNSSRRPVSVLSLWMNLELEHGDPGEVILFAGSEAVLPDSPALQRLKADAFFLQGDVERGLEQLQIREQNPVHLRFRMNENLRDRFLLIRYGDPELSADEIPAELEPYYLNRMMGLSEKKWEAAPLTEPGEWIADVENYFHIAIMYIEHLAALSETGAAAHWMNLIPKEDLNLAKKRRVEETKRLIRFVDQQN